VVVDIPEELAEDLGSGHELDQRLSEMADEVGVPWVTSKDDFWDESGDIDVDCEDVGDEYDDYHPVLVARPKEGEAT
jgi:hypothetical protein